VIWDALKGTCEAPDPETARLIIESAGIIVGKADGTVFYDERGAQKLHCLVRPRRTACEYMAAVLRAPFYAPSRGKLTCGDEACCLRYAQQPSTWTSVP